jgi:hypothetical protein
MKGLTLGRGVLSDKRGKSHVFGLHSAKAFASCIKILRAEAVGLRAVPLGDRPDGGAGAAEARYPQISVTILGGVPSRSDHR